MSTQHLNNLLFFVNYCQLHKVVDATLIEGFVVYKEYNGCSECIN